jgi:hypothetical protein
MSVKNMNEEEKGVEEPKEPVKEPEEPTEEVETPAVPTEENEQGEEPVESVIPIPDGKDYKAIAEQLSKDIKEKNRKIQEQKKILEDAKQSIPQVVQPVISEDETVQRFLRTEANATIAVKLQTDPSFKDRVEIVQNYVAQGYDINMADKLAKADIMDQILAESSTPVQSNPPKTPKPTATPEQVKPKSTGNILDDIQQGKADVKLDGISQADLGEVLARYRA